MPRSQLGLLVFLLVAAALPCAVPVPLAGQSGGQAAWTWKDSTGARRTRAELDAILRQHQEWANSNGAKGRRAELPGADLSGAQLTGANLMLANLAGADLENANASGTDFTQATLTGAKLEGANLKNTHLGSGTHKAAGAVLNDADLTHADLTGADLEGANADAADFTAANLSRANLSGASLKRSYFGGGTDAAPGAMLQEVDLSGANLDGANLTRADLTSAILISADLNSADFTNVTLNGADLTLAVLTGADLGGAKADGTDFTTATLNSADLSGAKLTETHFEGANDATPGAVMPGLDLSGANLAGADFTGATLTRADLSTANLSGDAGGADFSGADLEGAIYEPHQGTDLSMISKAFNLSTIQYKDDSQPIFSLRNAFRDGGFVQQERDVNEAYRNHKPDFAVQLRPAGQRSFGQELIFWGRIAKYWLSQAMFDWTCGWGAKPGKPLLIIAINALLCAPIYLFGMNFKLGRGGIYMVATSGPVAFDGSKQRVVRIEVHPDSKAGSNGEPPKRWTPEWWDARRSAAWKWIGNEARGLKTALFFSLMSVFNIGYESFDAGQWIRALMGREFDLKARGWMRTLSGLQSLLGVGLLALAILSYFGHPFE
jgi:uncharacterized protein YjbI with pentapeptide repeats